MILNLPLPDSIQKFINQQVAIEGYNNAAEYIWHLNFCDSSNECSISVRSLKP